MSAIIAGGLSALIVLLATNGFSKIQEKIDSRTGDTILSATTPDGKPFTVQIKNNAIVSPQFDLVRLLVPTTQTTFRNSNQPDFELKNESSVIKRIFAITFIPNASFQADGILKMTLNEAPLFPITDQIAGDLQDVTALNIPIPDNYGLKILPKEKFKLFLADPSGAGGLAGSIAVFIGELP